MKNLCRCGHYTHLLTTKSLCVTLITSGAQHKKKILHHQLLWIFNFIPQKNLKMFPRACYKCGETGHIADDCQQQERLCYNCRQPGHESSACPEPKTTASKQCYSCGDVGHVQSDCPNASQGSKCYTCSEFGHISRECPQAGSAPASSAPPRRTARFSGKATTCYKCGGPNHFAKDCQAGSVKCYSCGKTGHISKECNLATDKFAKACYQCGKTGHISKNCVSVN